MYPGVGKVSGVWHMPSHHSENGPEVSDANQQEDGRLLRVPYHQGIQVSPFSSIVDTIFGAFTSSGVLDEVNG